MPIDHSEGRCMWSRPYKYSCSRTSCSELQSTHPYAPFVGCALSRTREQYRVPLNITLAISPSDTVCCEASNNKSSINNVASKSIYSLLIVRQDSFSSKANT